MSPASTRRRCRPAPTTAWRQPLAASRSRLRRPADGLFDPDIVPARSAVDRAGAYQRGDRDGDLRAPPVDNRLVIGRAEESVFRARTGANGIVEEDISGWPPPRCTVAPGLTAPPRGVWRQGPAWPVPDGQLRTTQLRPVPIWPPPLPCLRAGAPDVGRVSLHGRLACIPRARARARRPASPASGAQPQTQVTARSSSQTRRGRRHSGAAGPQPLPPRRKHRRTAGSRANEAVAPAEPVRNTPRRGEGTPSSAVTHCVAAAGVQASARPHPCNQHHG